MHKIQSDPAQKPRPPKGYHTIRFPITEAEYERFLDDLDFARVFLDALIRQHPEGFPEPMLSHYVFYGFTAPSRKLGLRCRRVRLRRRVRLGRRAGLPAGSFVRAALHVPSERSG